LQYWKGRSFADLNKLLYIAYSCSELIKQPIVREKMQTLLLPKW